MACSLCVLPLGTVVTHRNSRITCSQCGHKYNDDTNKSTYVGTTGDQHEFELFFDIHCPECGATINLLSSTCRKDNKARVEYAIVGLDSEGE